MFETLASFLLCIISCLLSSHGKDKLFLVHVKSIEMAWLAWEVCLYHSNILVQKKFHPPLPSPIFASTPILPFPRTNYWFNQFINLLDTSFSWLHLQQLWIKMPSASSGKHSWTDKKGFPRENNVQVCFWNWFLTNFIS